jgi:hypothetical protein
VTQPRPTPGSSIGLVGLDQTHANQSSVVPIDHVPAQLKLGQDRCRERDPLDAQLGERERLSARMSQPGEQSLLLRVWQRHLSDCLAAPDTTGGRLPERPEEACGQAPEQSAEG